MVFIQQFIKIDFIALSLLPFTILLGPSVFFLNILLLSVIFFVNYDKKLSSILNIKEIRLLFLLYVYLIFNTFISLEPNLSLARNFGFLRYIILFIAINYIFFKRDNYSFLIFWKYLIIIIFFDIYFEYFFGKNIFGYISNFPGRIVSFFKDEHIVGAYINGFYFIIFGYFLKNNNKITIKKKFFISIFLILAVISISMTGERSNTIKFFLGIFLLFLFNKNIKLLSKFYFFSSIIFLFILILNYSPSIKHRYINELSNRILKVNNSDYIYFKLYKSGFDIFKNNYFFGIGNKNYRALSCEDKKYFCSTHPHQIYIELLSEHGLIGTLIILSIIFYLIFKNYQILYIERNLIQIGCLIYMLLQFLPIIPSGAFFSSFNSNLFWLNFSIFYAVNKSTNIFNRG